MLSSKLPHADNKSDEIYSKWKSKNDKLEAIKALAPISRAGENTDMVYQSISSAALAMFKMRERQKELKEEASINISSLDLASSIDVVSRLHNSLKSNGLSEAETMARTLKETGINPDKIIIETDAVDTGKIIQKTDILMIIEYIEKNHTQLITQQIFKKDEMQLVRLLKSKLQKRLITAEEQEKLIKIITPVKDYLINNNIVIYKNIPISGTPAGLLRQFLSYQKQTTLPWKLVSCVCPDNLIVCKFYKIENL